jgi:hypothetical protein
VILEYGPEGLDEHEETQENGEELTGMCTSEIGTLEVKGRRLGYRPGDYVLL